MTENELKEKGYLFAPNVDVNNLSVDLSNQERLDAYIWVKENFETMKGGPFLCAMLKEWVWRTKGVWLCDDFLKVFPEMAQQQPDETFIPGGAWWSFTRSMDDGQGNVHRKIALLQSIKLVQAKMENENNNDLL